VEVHAETWQSLADSPRRLRPRLASALVVDRTSRTYRSRFGGCTHCESAVRAASRA